MDKFTFTDKDTTYEFATEAEAKKYADKLKISVEINKITEDIPVFKDFPLVSARQIRLALVKLGFSLEKIDAGISNFEEPELSEVKISWEYATEFHRYSPLLDSVGEKLGFTPDNLDDLFSLAYKLRPRP